MLFIILLVKLVGDWGLGIGDWGLGAQSPIPNPQNKFYKFPILYKNLDF
jgi:hypothetical protein